MNSSEILGHIYSRAGRITANEGQKHLREFQEASMKRSRSNLALPEQEPSWKEPLSGPRSATCYCRRMARRDMRIEAVPGLYGENLPEHKPTAILVDTDADIEEISSALKELRNMGLKIEVRIIAAEAVGQ